MPLPSSGTITLNAILAEFGAPLGTGLNAMVKGGAYVPSTVAASIPTAPPISLSDFYGAFRPPSIAIQSATASVSGDGSLTGASVADLTGSFVVTTTDPFVVGDQDSSVSATLTVPVKILTASTPTLLLSVGAQNPQGGGFIYPNQSVAAANAPPFDDLVQLQNANGPGAQDTVDSYQGTWSIVMPQIASGITVGGRVNDATELGPVVDNDIVNLTFNIALTFKARIGNGANFGQILTFDLGAATRVTFRVSLLFIDGSANIVQDVPVDIIITHKGRIRAQAFEF